MALFLPLALVACAGGQPDPPGATVAATVAPIAELVASIGRSAVEVELVLPAGAEPHDAALDADQIDVLRSAQVVFFIGEGFQPAAEDALRTHPRAIDLLDGTAGPPGDPHVWLDPVAMQGIARTIVAELTAALPSGGDVFAANSEAAVDRLQALDDALEAALAPCDRRVLITSHEAFGHLAARYGLEQHGITGITPGAAPDPKRLAELIDLVRASGTTTVFAEAREPGDLAQTLARETGARVEVLDPIETIPPGESYDGLMRSNLDALVRALGCEP